jgi:hypothetical protein
VLGPVCARVYKCLGLCEHDFGVFVAVCMCLCQWYNTIVQYTYVCVLTCMFIYVCVMCK